MKFNRDGFLDNIFEIDDVETIYFFLNLKPKVKKQTFLVSSKVVTGN